MNWGSPGWAVDCSTDFWNSVNRNMTTTDKVSYREKSCEVYSNSEWQEGKEIFIKIYIKSYYLYCNLTMAPPTYPLCSISFNWPYTCYSSRPGQRSVTPKYWGRWIDVFGMFDRLPVFQSFSSQKDEWVQRKTLSWPSISDSKYLNQYIR